MFQKVTFSAICFLISLGVFSQSYSLTPNDSLTADAYREDLTTLTINQINTSSDSITLKWKKVSATYPANWDLTVCDNRICYGSLVDSGTMVKIASGESALLLIHCTGHVNYGTAIVRYALWDAANPAVKDTLTYIFNVTLTGISAITVEKSAAWCIGNTLYLNEDISHSDAISIIDQSGREVYRSSVNNQSAFDISDFAPSIYYAQIQNGTKAACIKFIKQ